MLSSTKSTTRRVKFMGIWSLSNLVGSHLLYLRLHIGVFARRRLWFCLTRGFHVNLGVYFRFSIYLAILVDCSLSCLLLVPLCPSSWRMVELAYETYMHGFFDMLMMRIDVLVS
jgi:hypothetical protein